MGCAMSESEKQHEELAIFLGRITGQLELLKSKRSRLYTAGGDDLPYENELLFWYAVKLYDLTGQLVLMMHDWEDKRIAKSLASYEGNHIPDLTKGL